MHMHLELGRVGERGDEQTLITAYSDASWCSAAGYRSTSGACVAVDGLLVNTLARTQAVTALSTAEAELIALVAGSQEVVLLKNVLQELGMKPVAVVRSDSSAALAITQKKGPGRIKHVALRALKVQEWMREKIVRYEFVQGVENWADLLTKALVPQRVMVLSRGLGLEGRQDDDEQNEDDKVISMIEEPEHDSSEGLRWAYTVVALVAGIVASIAFFGGWCCARRRRRTCEVAVQSPTTYTEVRKVAIPRFVVLPEAQQGAWRQ